MESLAAEVLQKVGEPYSGETRREVSEEGVEKIINNLEFCELALTRKREREICTRLLSSGKYDGSGVPTCRTPLLCQVAAFLP